MTVRISRRDDESAEGATLTVEGQLTGEGAELLVEYCQSIEGDRDAVAIDLTGVRFVDADAASILLGLERRGARLEHASYYVRQLIDLAEREIVEG